MRPLQTLTASSRRLTCLVMLACTASLLGCNAREGASRSCAPPGGAAGSGWTADPSPMVLESVKVPDAPALYGQVEEAWSKARPLTVDVREAMGGDHPKPVVLRAIHTDDSFFILAQWPDLNGQKLFEVEDDTFAESGNVGLWTKADSVIHFDNFRVRPLDPMRPATTSE